MRMASSDGLAKGISRRMAAVASRRASGARMPAKDSMAARWSWGVCDPSQINHWATIRGPKYSWALSRVGALPAKLKASAHPTIAGAALSAAMVSKNAGERAVSGIKTQKAKYQIPLYELFHRKAEISARQSGQDRGADDKR